MRKENLLKLGSKKKKFDDDITIKGMSSNEPNPQPLPTR